jgi:hypothetical protein
MNPKDPMMTEKYVRNATAIFDQLMESSRIRSRLLVVDNPDLTSEEQDRVADNIAGSILKYASLTEKQQTI